MIAAATEALKGAGRYWDATRRSNARGRVGPAAITHCPLAVRGPARGGEAHTSRTQGAGTNEQEAHAMNTHHTLGAQFAPTYHRPFLRYFEGENGGAPGGDPAPAAPTPAPTPAPAPAPAPPAPQPAPPAPAPINYKGDPDEYVRELRAENKTAREAREAAEKERDAAAQEREAAAAERDTLKREKAVLLAAPRLGANADLLLDSGSFTKTLAGIDLADQAAVDKAITDALERNSAFRTGPALPPSSGGGHQGGSPSTPTPTLEGAVKAHFGG